MYSDTHFHFKNFVENGNGDGTLILTKMVQNDCYFGMDIGTKPSDLAERKKCIDQSLEKISDKDVLQKAEKMLHYSAGIWPSLEDIQNRKESVAVLKKSIEEFSRNNKLTALGEIGLDHHWNPSGVDGRCEGDFTSEIYNGEKELFLMQLDYARELKLPVVIHSRDAFEDTLACIKEAGYHNGIIHCYSYGLEEAEKFLDLGWYISFSGSVTYVKKSKLEEMKKLLAYIPEDRILCETDSPYLAPVPMRGQANNPLFVEHTYRYVAAAREISVEKLSCTVDENIRRLFGL